MVNHDVKKVGERLGGYCVAYLQATLDVVNSAPGSICVKPEDDEPQYLLSVFETYIKDEKVDKSTGASKQLAAAYRRAFRCTATPKK